MSGIRVWNLEKEIWMFIALRPPTKRYSYCNSVTAKNRFVQSWWMFEYAKCNLSTAHQAWWIYLAIKLQTWLTTVNKTRLYNNLLPG